MPGTGLRGNVSAQGRSGLSDPDWISRLEYRCVTDNEPFLRPSRICFANYRPFSAARSIGPKIAESCSNRKWNRSSVLHLHPLSLFLQALSVGWRLWETMRLAFDNRTSVRTLWRLFSRWTLDRLQFSYARELWNAMINYSNSGGLLGRSTCGHLAARTCPLPANLGSYGRCLGRIISIQFLWEKLLFGFASRVNYVSGGINYARRSFSSCGFFSRISWETIRRVIPLSFPVPFKISPDRPSLIPRDFGKRVNELAAKTGQRWNGKSRLANRESQGGKRKHSPGGEL